MNKTIALDSNVILNFMDTIEHNDRFKDCKFVVSMKVLSELDNLKEFGKSSEIKFKSRRGSRIIESMMEENRIIIVDYIHNNDMSPDDMIINSYLEYSKNNQLDYVLSNDLNFRLKSKALGLHAEKYNSAKKDEYTGYYDIVVSNEVFLKLMVKSEYMASKFIDVENTIPNCCVRFINEMNKKQNLLYIFDTNNNKLISVELLKKDISLGRIKPLTDEQVVFMWLLENENIKCVASDSVAGSAKTLFSLAHGIEGIKKGKYKSIMYLKTLNKVGGAELGFYTGDKCSKLEQEAYSSVVYALKTIHNLFRVEDAWGVLHAMIDKGEFIVENLGDIRGISLDESICVIMDEFQNSDLEVAITGISRCGERNVKAIVLGSSSQIDNKYVSKYDNGLTMIIESEAYKNSKITGSINMIKSKRSELAQLSYEIYKEYN